MLVSGIAGAGGPLIVDDAGNILVWNTAQPIPYRTDGGNLSTGINTATAQARVRAAVRRLGERRDREHPLLACGSDPGRNGILRRRRQHGGGVRRRRGCLLRRHAEPDRLRRRRLDVRGPRHRRRVIGFAGPCASDATGQIVSGRAVMNGIFLDGVDTVDNLELSPAEFDAAFVHEFGHFSGLDHSQVNLNCCLNGPCSSDDLSGLPTMFPFLISVGDGHAVDRRRRLDLEAATRRRRAAASPRLTGRFPVSSTSPTASRICSLPTSSPGAWTAGGNEDRRIAASSVSGLPFQHHPRQSDHERRTERRRLQQSRAHRAVRDPGAGRQLHRRSRGHSRGIRRWLQRRARPHHRSTGKRAAPDRADRRCAGRGGTRQ